MLTFVGLGLYDERSITLEGRDAIERADRVFAEFYTSRLAGADVEALERLHGVSIEVRDRDGVEGDPGPILEAATAGNVAFLTGGDPMTSTTHVDLRLRAAERGIPTAIVHGTTAATAASGLTGLQNYRFGPSTTLPFPGSVGDGAVPGNVVDTVEANRDRGLHTLLYLDIRAEHDAYLTGDRAAAALEPAIGDVLGVVVARAGGPSPTVRGDRLSALAAVDFGGPLHLLVLPGRLHHMEAEALQAFADVPRELVEEG